MEAQVALAATFFRSKLLFLIGPENFSFGGSDYAML
eukprot:SAG11_NODE_744_length_7406_cov_2.773231_2_plen_36_part_00